jgi:AcrR family transcriptional regulator
MLDKKTQIVEAADLLFDKQGFKATSMQEVANHAGVSKGSVYLHFKSKDELLLAVCERHTDKITQRIKEILHDKSLSPLEKLAAQISFQLEEIQDYQSFYQSLFHDEAIKIGPELILYYQEYRIEWMQLQESFLLSIYGEFIQPWVVDLAITLDGLIASYLTVTVIEQIELDTKPLVDWIVRCIDKVVSGITIDNPKAVLSESMIASRAEIVEKKNKLKGRYIEQALERLEEKSLKLKISTDARETLEASLTHIKDQLSNEKHDKVMLRALLAGLRTYRGLSKERQALAEKLEIELV